MTTPAAAFRHLGVSSEGGIARLVLRRPPLNILHTEMLREMSAALAALAREPALRVLVIAAEGKAFSAGVSVEEHLPPQARTTITAFHDVFRRLSALGAATVAGVKGAALGGGCELACFADFVVAAESATFGLPEIRLASFPPVAAALFPSRIGTAATLRLVLTGEVIPAAEALRLGLVDKVVPAAEVDAAVDALASGLAERSAPALRLARRAVLGQDFEARLVEAERLFLDELMSTADATEGLRAFLEKRPPGFAHR